MTKTYELECPKHGRLKIEVEKPPLKFRYMAYCPFCLETIRKPEKADQKFQQNLVSEGAPA